MTKRDFQLIADTIAALPPIPHAGPNIGWGRTYQRTIAERFATSLADTNPRFDRERFLMAAVGEWYEFTEAH